MLGFSRKALVDVRECSTVQDCLRRDATDRKHGQPTVLNLAQLVPRLLCGVRRDV